MIEGTATQGLQGQSQDGGRLRGVMTDTRVLVLVVDDFRLTMRCSSSLFVCVAVKSSRNRGWAPGDEALRLLSSSSIVSHKIREMSMLCIGPVMTAV